MRTAVYGTLCADADPQNILEPPTGGRYFCAGILFLFIFSVLRPMTRSARGITSIIQKRLDKFKRDMILDR